MNKVEMNIWDDNNIDGALSFNWAGQRKRSGARNFLLQNKILIKKCVVRRIIMWNYLSVEWVLLFFNFGFIEGSFF